MGQEHSRFVGRREEGAELGLDLLDLLDLLLAGAPDLLLGQVAESERPLVVEVEQVARLLEADGERVRYADVMRLCAQ